LPARRWECPWHSTSFFAAIGIALPLALFVVEGMFLRSGQRHYLQLARRWAKVTGLLFAVGAISGTALSFELGLLWPDVRLIASAAPSATLRFMLWSLPIGLMLIVPSLWLFFHTFKVEHLRKH
jgi:cytochrome d ubiquinol oxidase subunit I